MNRPHTAAQRASTLPAHVLLITAPDCHFCMQAKDLLDRLGRAYPLEIEELSLTSPDGQDLAVRHGILFPPGLLLDSAFVGFGRVSERKLCRLLDQRAQRLVAAPVEGI